MGLKNFKNLTTKSKKNFGGSENVERYKKIINNAEGNVAPQTVAPSTNNSKPQNSATKYTYPEDKSTLRQVAEVTGEATKKFVERIPGTPLEKMKATNAALDFLEIPKPEEVLNSVKTVFTGKKDKGNTYPVANEEEAVLKPTENTDEEEYVDPQIIKQKMDAVWEPGETTNNEMPIKQNNNISNETSNINDIIQTSTTPKQEDNKLKNYLNRKVALETLMPDFAKGMKGSQAQLNKSVEPIKEILDDPYRRLLLQLTLNGLDVDDLKTTENQEPINTETGETEKSTLNPVVKGINTGVGVLADLGTGVLEGAESIVDTAIAFGGDKVLDSIDKQIENISVAAEKEYYAQTRGKNLTPDEKQKIYDSILQQKTAIIVKLLQERGYTQSFIEEFVGEKLVGDAIGNPVRQFTEEYTYLPAKAGDIVRNIGSILPSIYLGGKVSGAIGGISDGSKAAAFVQKAGGIAPFVVQSTGASVEEAINEGTEFDEAYNYGKMAGLMEGVIEGISGGIGGAAGNKILNNKLSKDVINRISKNLIGKYALKLADAGIDVAGEGFEEVLSTYANPFLKRLSYDEQAELATNEELMQSFWDGVLASIVLKGGQAGAVKLSNKINSGANPQTTEKNNEYEKLVPTGKNGVPQTPQSAPNSTGNQTISSEIKVAQNGNMEQTTQNDKVMDTLLGRKSEKAQNPVQIRAEETLKSAQQAGMTDVDINKATELNNLLQSNARLQFYDENNLPQGFSEEDIKKVKVANGLYSNGTIYINKNSKKVVEKILGHELTHHLETTGSFNDLANTILDSDVFYDYMTKKGFQNIQAFKQSLLDNGYAEQQLDNEMVARFVEDNLFSNQESINRIARKNATLAEKIKNFISDLKVKVKGTAQEKQLMKIEDMYRKALEQARSTENTTSDTKYHISNSLSNDIDNVLNGTYSKNEQVKARDYTPEVLVNSGVPDLPMLITQNHVKSTIYSLEEAKQLGLPTKNVNYHGLGKELLIKAIDNLDNPRAIYKKGENDYIIVTEIKNQSGEDIIVPVRINSKGNYNNVYIDENQITSVYGKRKLENYISNNNLELIYNKKETSDFNEGVQYSNVANVSNNSINQNDSSVNTQYSLDNQNDTAGKEPAFSMPSIKEQQLKIVQESNPANDDYHTWIRTVEDIKTFDEVIDDEESFVWGDFSKEDAQKALEKGEVTVYSSKEIKNGNFVSTSYNQARDYAGGGKIYSKTVPLKDVAWINGDEGQYAKVYKKPSKVSFSLPETDNQGRKLTVEQQEFFKDSKVRDKDGKLLEVYHGTNEDFTMFDKKYLGSGSGDLGFLGDGFYFATHKGEAKYYGGKVMPVYLNIKNPYNIRELFKYNGKYLNGEGSNEYLEIANLVSLHNEWADIEIESTTYGEIQKEVQGFLDNVEIKYLGKVDDRYGDVSDYWSVKYKNYNEKIMTIEGYSEDSLKADCLNRYMRRKVGYINSHDTIQYITEYSKYEGGKSLADVLQEKGYDGIFQAEYIGDEIVAFEPNQIKNVDNTNPTENADIRFSMNPVEVNEQLKEKAGEYSALKQGEKATRAVELPKQISNNKYVSQFARTMAEAGITPNEEVDQIKRMVLDGTLTHERITDKSALKYADKIINEDGFKGAVDMWNSAMKSDLTMDKKMIALGQQIYNQAVQNKDITLVKQMIADLTYISTVSGQNVQASRMFKKLTPDGKLYSIEKSLKKINEDLLQKYQEKFEEIEIPKVLAKKLLEAEDTTTADKIVEEIEEYIAKKIPASLMDKLNAWRYLAMLGNPKTHIRNIIGNAAFVPVVELKNTIGTGLEKLIPQNQRTKAIINPINKSDKKLLDFAEYDFDSNKKHIKGEDKFNIATNINDKRRIFDNKLLESARKFNSDMLEFEDELFFKRAYKSSLAQAMKARGITVDYARENSAESNETMNEIRDYAILEAQKATYRDFNKLANILSNTQKKLKSGYDNSTDIKDKVKYKAGELALEGLVPFKKTPTNILSRGVSYSPLGLMRGIGNAVLNVKKGNITAAQAIDQISQGLSGTSILALGILLAKFGILSGADKEDEKEAKFDKLKGSQNYALNIGDTSYTIDWLAPTSMPLFVGVELYKGLSGESDDDILTTIAKITEPAFEMSMLQGISSTLNSAKYSKTNIISSIAGNLTLNYINQYNPTLFGQIARTLEDTSRTTYVDKNSSQPAWLQKMIQKNVAKIPVANKSLVPVIDQWGRTKTEESILSRAVQNFISPGYVSKKNITEVDKEIERLYKQVGEKDILPSYAPKYWNVNGERVDLTAKQYEKFAVEKGQDALNLIGELIKSDAYKKLDDKGKYNAIKYIYDYANQTNKVEITPEYPMDDWIKDAQELEKQGIDVETFIGLKIAVKDIKGDKDLKGNTKPYSASNKKKKVIDELIPGYSKKQKNLIYDALGISTKK